MKYIDYEFYKTLYGEENMQESDFNRISWKAEREVDKATTGIDGVKKLKVAFPLDEEDAETVKRCIVELVNFLYMLEEAERNANSLNQLQKRDDGSMQGKVVSSVSAGNESISYAVGKSIDTVFSNAIKDLQSKDKTIYQFISNELRDITDANGVNLLFAGAYPYKIRMIEVEDEKVEDEEVKNEELQPPELDESGGDESD